jgi:hypothetical protein
MKSFDEGAWDYKFTRSESILIRGRPGVCLDCDSAVMNLEIVLLFSVLFLILVP